VLQKIKVDLDKAGINVFFVAQAISVSHGEKSSEEPANAGMISISSLKQLSQYYKKGWSGLD
jgi:hypothetical protein